MRGPRIQGVYFLAMIVLILQSCVASKPTDATSKTTPVGVDQLMQWRTCDYQTIRTLLIRKKVHKTYRYPILNTGRDGISVYVEPSNLDLYFVDDKVVEIIQEQPETHMNPSEIHLDSLQKRFGPPEAYKPSRVAWQCMEWVYPSLGLTIVIREGRTLAYQLRVYQPTTLADYERYIWEDPGSLLDHMQH